MLTDPDAVASAVVARISRLGFDVPNSSPAGWAELLATRVARRSASGVRRTTRLLG